MSDLDILQMPEPLFTRFNSAPYSPANRNTLQDFELTLELISNITRTFSSYKEDTKQKRSKVGTKISKDIKIDEIELQTYVDAEKFLDEEGLFIESLELINLPPKNLIQLKTFTFDQIYNESLSPENMDSDEGERPSLFARRKQVEKIKQIEISRFEI